MPQIPFFFRERLSPNHTMKMKFNSTYRTNPRKLFFEINRVTFTTNDNSFIHQCSF